MIFVSMSKLRIEYEDDTTTITTFTCRTIVVAYLFIRQVYVICAIKKGSWQVKV